MKSTRLMYLVSMNRSKSKIIHKYGDRFWQDFRKESNRWLKITLPQLPNIGDSIFALNFDFCPIYIAWYKSFMGLGLTSEQAGEEIWMMNERLITAVPAFFMKSVQNAYLGGFRKKAIKHEKNIESLHPYDWKIKYREVSDRIFEIDIAECGMLKFSKDFDALGMYPMICRMDYLFSHYMGSGFERTKTLGDGDDCCNCRYTFNANCEWAPEKGFETRK